MISTLYLHEYDVLDTFLETTHHIMNDVFDTNSLVIANEQLVNEKLFLGESVDGYDLVLEDVKKNFFAKIGDSIIEIFKAFGEMVKDITKSIMNSVKGLRKTSADDALKKKVAENPDLAKKFVDGIISGNIKVNDVKDLNTLLDTTTKLSEDLMSGKLDEKSFNTKVDDALSAVEKKAKPIGAIIGATASAASLYMTVKKIISLSTQYDDQAVKAREEMNVVKERAMNSAIDDAKASGQGNSLSVWLSAQRRVMTALGKNYGVVNKIAASALDALSNLAAKAGNSTDKLKKSTDAWDRLNIHSSLNRAAAARDQMSQTKARMQAEEEFKRGKRT